MTTSREASRPARFLDAYAGAGAGLFGTLIGYPLDVVKGRMQVGGASMAVTIKDMYARESVAGFYRGVLPPIISLTLLNTINFSNYAFAVNALSIDRSAGNPIVFLAGAAVGPAAAVISTPFEFLKIQLQFSQRSSVPYKNTVDAAYKILRTYGVRTIYTGHIINTYREMLFLGTYFAVYEYVKGFLCQRMNTSLAIPVSGGLAGAIGWFVSFPLDAIKTNIQSVKLEKANFSSVPIMVAASKQFREKGILNMYKGVTPSILRAFVVSSSRFSVYETILWALSD